MELDHIAISGETLDAARSHVEDTLGVTLQSGGQHSVFSTHNALLGLADGLYLEAIAIDRDAPDPTRARWFDLDRFAGRPRLTNWICRCKDIATALDNLPIELGEPVSMHRGASAWHMAVPDDGILPFDNLAPALIQWETTPHPAALLVPSGVRLRRLTLSHPDGRGLEAVFAPHMDDDRIRYRTGEHGMVAEFDTPHGPRVLA